MTQRRCINGSLFWTQVIWRRLTRVLASVTFLADVRSLAGTLAQASHPARVSEPVQLSEPVQRTEIVQATAGVRTRPSMHAIHRMHARPNMQARHRVQVILSTLPIFRMRLATGSIAFSFYRSIFLVALWTSLLVGNHDSNADD